MPDAFPDIFVTDPKDWRLEKMWRISLHSGRAFYMRKVMVTSETLGWMTAKPQFSAAVNIYLGKRTHLHAKVMRSLILKLIPHPTRLEDAVNCRGATDRR